EGRRHRPVVQPADYQLAPGVPLPTVRATDGREQGSSLEFLLQGMRQLQQVCGEAGNLKSLSERLRMFRQKQLRPMALRRLKPRAMPRPLPRAHLIDLSDAPPEASHDLASELRTADAANDGAAMEKNGEEAEDEAEEVDDTSEAFSEGPGTDPAVSAAGDAPGPSTSAADLAAQALRLSGMDPAPPAVPSAAQIKLPLLLQRHSRPTLPRWRVMQAALGSSLLSASSSLNWVLEAVGDASCVELLLTACTDDDPELTAAPVASCEEPRKMQVENGPAPNRRVRGKHAPGTDSAPSSSLAK
ncbi:unnamed protein product, partial [Symbiodinium microadriaticum]